MSTFPNKHFLLKLFLVLLVVGIGLSYMYSEGIIPGKKRQTITVTASASSQETNEIAVFNATVMVNNADKATAIAEMNERMNSVMEEIKKFGIDEKDIKTQNFNIYQQQNYNPQTGENTLGDWVASTTVDVTLRDVTQASVLSETLAGLEISNVFGPMFQNDVDDNSDTALLAKATENAREKAAAIAKASGARLGRLVSFAEGGAMDPNYPIMYDRAMGGGGGMMEPGSTTNVKTVTVTYEIL